MTQTEWTKMRDKKVKALRKKGLLLKEIANRLELSLDQVKHSLRRMK